MKKSAISAAVVSIILSIHCSNNTHEATLLKTTHLPHYPSASTLEYFNNRLYVIGDDATSMLILDTSHQLLQTITLFAGTEKRLSKDNKPDFESSSLVFHKDTGYLLVFSSLSDRNRDKYLLYNFSNDSVHINHITPRLSTFHHFRIRGLNIEGAAQVKENVILASRYNPVSGTNRFIFTEYTMEQGLKVEQYRSIPFQLPRQYQHIGVSGLYYIRDKDLLLFTASTEQTADARQDGPIGASYIGLVRDMSKKTRDTAILADEILDLSPYITREGVQKIESVAFERWDGDFMIVHLASDNDNGESTLFKLKLLL